MDLVDNPIAKVYKQFECKIYLKALQRKNFYFY